MDALPKKDALQRENTADKPKKKCKKWGMILIPALVLLLIGGILLGSAIKKNSIMREKYELALALIADEDSTNDEQAMELFQELGEYQDAQTYLEGFACKTLWMEETSYTSEGAVSRHMLATCHYDSTGALCAVTVDQNGVINRSERVESCGPYTLVFYENGDIDGFLTQFPGLKLFQVRQADRQKQSVYFGQLMPAFYEYQVEVSAENGAIQLVMKPSSGEEGHVTFHENGDIQLVYQEGSERRGESRYRCTVSENTLQYRTENGGEFSCQFDENGMLEDLTMGGIHVHYEIELGSDGRSIRAVNGAGGAEEEIVWTSGYVYAPGD